jgi:hypothetical protein
MSFFLLRRRFEHIRYARNHSENAYQNANDGHYKKKYIQRFGLNNQSSEKTSSHTSEGDDNSQETSPQ